MNIKDIAKSMLPEGDSAAAGLAPDAARDAAKKQAQIIKKTVMIKRKGGTATAEPDFENVDLKKLKGQKK